MTSTPSLNPRLDDDESLFSRDVDGRLVRLDAATADQLDQDVTVVVDGRAIRVKRAVPAVDSQGRPRLDGRGMIVPRATTIHDAAEALVDAVPLLGPDGAPLVDEANRPVHRPRTPDDPRADGAAEVANAIPILCHQPHLDPVGVCRACVVEISRIKRGERRTERKLLPACQHRVEDAMEVRTIETSEKVRVAVRTVVELLAADHPSPCAKEIREPGACELESLAARLKIGARGEAGAPRFPRRAPRATDNTSLLIAVDHDACILCDRCVRGCNDVKDNQVIGRMLKGYAARIAFDLDAPMGNSSCVSCGECMVSCPTGALTFRAAIDVDFGVLDPPAEPVGARDLVSHRLPKIRRAFEKIPPAFLAFNAQAVVRRRFRPNQIICRQGKYGATAFFIEEGSAEIYLERTDSAAAAKVGGGFLGLFRRQAAPAEVTETRPERRFIPVDAPVVLPADRPEATLGAEALFGEMACLNAYPRSATVRAGGDGCVVLEMRRNVLDILRRSKSYRESLESDFRERVIKRSLASVPFLVGLGEAFLDDLSRAVSYRRCEPGEVIVRQGSPAGEPGPAGGLFLVRSGFVRFTSEQPGGQAVLNYLGPGNYFGEIGLLSNLPPEDFGPEGGELAAGLAEIRAIVGPGVRTATCSALDHVELVQVAPDRFRAILRAARPEVRRSIVALALERLRAARPSAAAGPGPGAGPEPLSVRGPMLRDFLDQGLMGAQSLLVLDLLKCTRCDECTKACTDTHGGVTRLIREGLRFDKFLVASSCRSCNDPVCLVGCPVDAIHRRPGSNEIWIESTCIGCGKCAENCPYGNINMHELPGGATARKATTCDQCRSLPGHQPNCVVACPHDAAHRMRGPDLFRLVQEATRF